MEKSNGRLVFLEEASSIEKLIRLFPEDPSKAENWHDLLENLLIKISNNVVVNYLSITRDLHITVSGQGVLDVTCVLYTSPSFEVRVNLMKHTVTLDESGFHWHPEMNAFRNLGGSYIVTYAKYEQSPTGEDRGIFTSSRESGQFEYGPYKNTTLEQKLCVSHTYSSGQCVVMQKDDAHRVRLGANVEKASTIQMKVKIGNPGKHVVFSSQGLTRDQLPQKPHGKKLPSSNDHNAIVKVILAIAECYEREETCRYVPGFEKLY